MSGGVLTVANSHGPVNWAVPGGNYFFAKYNGSVYNEGVPFQIIDITQDATNTYIHTTLSGGFPKLPGDNSNGLAIYAHPAPQFTCSNCTGSAAAIDLSQAPAGAPIYSYSKRTYTGNSLPVYRGQNLPIAHVWGTIVSVKVNVAVPYRGTQGAVTMNALGPYGIGAIAPDQSDTFYNPVINLNIPGERDLFPASVAGMQSDDSISPPGFLWSLYGTSPTISANIAHEPSSVWPTVTIEVTTDQGVVN
jgi:hypothetical protein